MESNDTKQSQQGQVSAPGESPKDVNQNTYTDEETSLAEKFKVEPKLVRLLKEIAEERLQFLTNCIEQNQRIIRHIEDKLGLEPWQATDDVAEPQEQPAEENHPDTGVPLLDDYYERLSLEAKVAVCGTMDLMCRAKEPGDKIREYLHKYLHKEIAIFEDPEEAEKQVAMDGQTWSECSWFLGFVIGTEMGLLKS
jgi:hypothetical protein